MKKIEDVAKEFELEDKESIVGAVKSSNIHDLVGSIGNLVTRVSLVAGVIILLFKADETMFASLILASLMVSLLAAGMKAYEAYKLQKAMKKEFERFMKHLSNNGFSAEDLGEYQDKNKLH